VHETYASLFSRSGDFDRAQKHVILAQEGLNRIDGYASISWISGLCAYRAASVAILQGRVQDAIEEAQKAAAIGRLYKAPIGNRARSTHALSKAFNMDPERKTEAEGARQEAHRLRGLLPAGRTDLDDENDEAFEMLVNIIQR
jgi:tetratricopeptide (TPR) repeat protein